MDKTEIIFSIPVVFLFTACARESIEVYRAPKEAPAPMAAMPGSGMQMPPGHPEISPGTVPPGAAAMGSPAGESGDLHWHAPDSWKEKPASSMRVGSYSVPGKDGEADMSIVMLAGEAGGILPNIERWRGQVGLGPFGSEKALAAGSSKVKTRAGTVLVVDLAGAGGKRLLAGILMQGGESWFFKMIGPASTVGAAKPGFLELLDSLHSPVGHE